MKLIINRAMNKEDYRSAITIESDNKKLQFFDGEPEDNILSRNFSDVYSIKALVMEAYEAGKAGQPMEIKDSEISWNAIVAEAL